MLSRAAAGVLVEEFTAAGSGDDAEDEGAGAHRYLLALLLAFVFALAVRPALDHDLWWHLRTAEWMIQHHDWIGVDPFQHTRPGVVRVQTDWLADLSYLAVWRAGGLAGVSLLVASLAAFGTALVYATTTGRFAVRVAVTALVAAAASIHWVSRPQMFTFVLTAAIVLLVRSWRDSTRTRGAGSRAIWGLVPLVVLGSNLHGGIVYAVLILLATVVGEWVGAVLARRPLRGVEVAPPLPASDRHLLTLATGVSVLGMSLNPSGARIYGLAFHQVDTAVEYVTEFRHPALSDLWSWPFWGLLALTVALLVRGWRRIDAVSTLPVLVTAALALQFVRSVPFFAIAAAPFVAERASVWWADRTGAGAPLSLTDRDHRRLRQALALVVVTIVVTTPFRIGGPRVAGDRADMFPVVATKWLNANQPPGELFNEFDWGGYLILHAPDYRVSIDGRTDVYGEYLETAIETVSAAPGWEAELDREGIGTVLIHGGVALDGALQGDPDWVEAYRDDIAVIFVRS